jgi:hypothetical protein
MAKRRGSRKLSGCQRGDLRPDWRPLIGLSPSDVPDFMWMYRVDLADGTVVEAYKHWSTRKYIYLDLSGRGYELVGEETFEEGDPTVLLVTAILDFEGGTDIVRQNVWVESENVTWARSATRHRVPRAQTLSVVRSAGVCFEDGTGRSDEPRLFFFGDDKQGRPLEIAAFEEANGGLYVVHSMPLRRRFKERYQEALRWRR